MTMAYSTRMLGWVVKVVPQPPDIPQKTETKEVPAAPPPAPPQEKKVTFKDEVSNANQSHKAPANEGSRPGTAVLSWISNAMPQPANANNAVNKEESLPESKGVIAWISQGFEKVVPHPELKNKEPPPPEKPVEVRPATAPAAPTTVEVKPSLEDKSDNKTSMIDWIKQGIEKVVPQPEHLKAKAENSVKNEAPPAPKVEPPPPPPPAPKPDDTLSAEQQTNVVGWIVNGLGRMLPQPVLKADGGNSAQNINSSTAKNDLVLEDLEKNNEKQQAPAKDEEEKQKKQAEAPDQMEHVSPMKENTKKETGETVLSQSEESRLQQERLDAARAAEEQALKAAEEAVRQLEVEQSAKIIIDSMPEPQDQSASAPADPAAEGVQPPKEVTPSTTEVEMVGDKKTAEAAQTKEVETQQQEPVSQPSTEKQESAQQPITDKQETESKPITQQPEPKATQEPPASTDQAPTAATEESGCGTPAICSPIRTFMLRFPLAAEYLESCKKLMHDHYLTPPKLSLPSPPPDLALLAQEIAELPKQVQQYCLGIINKVKGLNTHFQSGGQTHPSDPSQSKEQAPEQSNPPAKH